MLSKTYIQKIGEGFYRLASGAFANNYYVVSDAGTCRLMASPEVVGFDSYLAMLPATSKTMAYFKERGLESVDIFTILRGGLNYPLEQACRENGIRVPNINFISCERTIIDGVITGLDTRYEKISVVDGITLAIGDIIASGQTLDLCLRHVINTYRDNGKQIRKIIFFTIGGTKAIRLMENITVETRKFWPSFEGFECVFYEGIFRVYEDKGITGVNTPDIDFFWNGGAVSPEFKKYVFNFKHAPALLEKCIIYDGGARRYTIKEHIEELRDYWDKLLSVADSSCTSALVEEKLGYGDIGYDEWIEVNHYYPSSELAPLYERERQYVAKLCCEKLSDICRSRLEQITNDFKEYE